MNTEITLLRNDLTSEWLRHFLDADRVAWDIETSGLEWRVGQIGTCQLHAPEAGTVVVQLGSARPVRLAELLSEPSVRKIFHHAPFDLRWMIGHWNVKPASIDCTKVASRLLNQNPDSGVHSLKHLLSKTLGIEIDKGQRLTDWLVSDLTADQLAYAVADVTYLLPLLDTLKKDLANAGMIGLYQSCADFLPTRAALEVGGWPDIFGY